MQRVFLRYENLFPGGLCPGEGEHLQDRDGGEDLQAPAQNDKYR